MKEKRILDALNEVKDEYINEVKIEEKKKQKRYWVRWTALAASLALLLIFGTDIKNYIWPKQIDCGPGTEDDINSEELDVTIDIEKDAGFSVVTSSNEIMEMDEHKQLITKNPWDSEMANISFPIYKNLAYVSDAGAPAYLSEEVLLEVAKDVAQKLGTSINESRYDFIEEEGVEGYGKPYMITAYTELGEIIILGNGSITIRFDESIILPEAYKLTNDKDIYEAEEAMNYLAKEYQELMGEGELIADCAVSYDLMGNRSIFYRAYAQSCIGNPLVEYCFSRVRFIGDENGNLSAIQYGDVRTAAVCISQEFIITEEEARIRLEEGNFYSILSATDAKGGAFSDENIAKVELTYLTGLTCQYFQPYYCFYVEIESDTANTINYCTFYVPALTDSVLENFVETNPIGN